MNSLATFEELTEFIREFAGLSSRTQIEHPTQFDKDLGITGDDGCELLEKVEKHFKITLSSAEHGYRDTFHLKLNEYLFNSEGYDLFGFLRRTHIRNFTVGELYDAMCQVSRDKIQA